MPRVGHISHRTARTSTASCSSCWPWLYPAGSGQGRRWQPGQLGRRQPAQDRDQRRPVRLTGSRRYSVMALSQGGAHHIDRRLTPVQLKRRRTLSRVPRTRRRRAKANVARGAAGAVGRPSARYAVDHGLLRPWLHQQLVAHRRSVGDRSQPEASGGQSPFAREHVCLALKLQQERRPPRHPLRAGRRCATDTGRSPCRCCSPDTSVAKSSVLTDSLRLVAGSTTACLCGIIRWPGIAGGHAPGHGLRSPRADLERHVGPVEREPRRRRSACAAQRLGDGRPSSAQAQLLRRSRVTVLGLVTLEPAKLAVKKWCFLSGNHEVE